MSHDEGDSGDAFVNAFVHIPNVTLQRRASVQWFPICTDMAHLLTAYNAWPT